MKKQLITTVLIILTISVFAQTKQEIYNDPNIVWAGIIDLDFVIDADTNTNWKEYAISGFGDWFIQKTADSNPNKTLNEIIIENVETVQFYEYDSLKYKKDYEALELYDLAYKPETYGEKGRPYTANEFNVFSLKCFIYYDKSTLDFKISPQAVAVMRPEYDVPEEVLTYDILGWLPIEHLTKAIKINDATQVYNFKFERDIAFYSAKVFKQEWTEEEVVDDFMTNIRRKAETIALYDYYETKRMDSERIKTLGLDEIYGLRFDTYEETLEYVSWSPEVYQGIRFSMNWFWSTEKQQLSILTTCFSPLIFVEDDGGNVLGIEALFTKYYRN